MPRCQRSRRTTRPIKIDRSTPFGLMRRPNPAPLSQIGGGGAINTSLKQIISSATCLSATHITPPHPTQRMPLRPPLRRRAARSSYITSTRSLCLLLLLAVALLLLPSTAAQQPPRPDSGIAAGKGFLASVADRVGEAIFGGGCGMGQAAGKPFGARAAGVVNKPLQCTTGWEREERRETGAWGVGCFGKGGVSV